MIFYNNSFYDSCFLYIIKYLFATCMTDFVINSTLIIVTHVVVTKNVGRNNNQPQIIQCKDIGTSFLKNVVFNLKVQKKIKQNLFKKICC